MTTDPAHHQKIVAQFTRWAAPFSALDIHSEADGMRRTLAAAQLTASMRVLDVACGPGIVACAAAAQAGHVTGIDLTGAMIDQAEMRRRREGLSNIDWRIGDATSLPFADTSFDVAFARYSFHHLLAPMEALREMRRVVAPGGRVVVIDATPTRETQAAYDRMEKLRDPSHTSALTREQLRDLGRDAALIEESIDGYELEARLDTLADAGDMAALIAMFDEDIRSGENRIGVSPRHEADGIYFRFPITIMAWRTPCFG